MAGGTVYDVKLYQEQVDLGAYEIVSQAFDKFNANSGGAIIMRSELMKGNYRQEAFWELAGSVVRRKISSVADVSDTKVTQDEIVAPKISWRFGPFAQTLDSYKKKAKSSQEFSYTLGQQFGGQLASTMLSAATAALKGIFYASDAAGAAARLDASSDATGTPTYDKLFKGMAKLGDRGMMTSAFLLNGESMYKLVGNSLGDKMDSVAGVWISTGDGPAIGKRWVVTDSSYLRVDANSIANDYSLIYGLLPGALVLTDSEERTTHLEVVGDKENLLVRYRVEGSFNLQVKGFKFSTSALNPSDADLATKTNWTLAASSIKDGPGFLVIDRKSVV